MKTVSVLTKAYLMFFLAFAFFSCTKGGGSGPTPTPTPFVVPSCVVSTFAGITSYGFANGMGTNAMFSFPYGITIDGDDNLYVTDIDNSAVRKITSTGTVSTVAHDISFPYGWGGNLVYGQPGIGIAIAGGNDIYVAGSCYKTGDLYPSFSIWQMVPPLTYFTPWAGNIQTAGEKDGTGDNALFENITGITYDHAGNFYVTDGSTIRMISSAGVVTTLAGNIITGYGDGLGAAARFQSLNGITIDPSGNLYVTDGGNNDIRKITPGGMVSTVAGSDWFGPSFEDGPDSVALFNNPSGITIDGKGNLYICDQKNECIRMITTSGVVCTLAGYSHSQGSENGSGAVATFNHPAGITIDSNGNLYVTDTYNSEIRKITIQ